MAEEGVLIPVCVKSRIRSTVCNLQMSPVSTIGELKTEICRGYETGVGLAYLHDHIDLSTEPDISTVIDNRQLISELVLTDGAVCLFLCVDWFFMETVLRDSLLVSWDDDDDDNRLRVMRRNFYRTFTDLLIGFEEIGQHKHRTMLPQRIERFERHLLSNERFLEDVLTVPFIRSFHGTISLLQFAYLFELDSSLTIMNNIESTSAVMKQWMSQNENHSLIRQYLNFKLGLVSQEYAKGLIEYKPFYDLVTYISSVGRPGDVIVQSGILKLISACIGNRKLFASLNTTPVSNIKHKLCGILIVDDRLSQYEYDAVVSALIVANFTLIRCRIADGADCAVKEIEGAYGDNSWALQLMVCNSAQSVKYIEENAHIFQNGTSRTVLFTTHRCRTIEWFFDHVYYTEDGIDVTSLHRLAAAAHFGVWLPSLPSEAQNQQWPESLIQEFGPSAMWVRLQEEGDSAQDISWINNDVEQHTLKDVIDKLDTAPMTIMKVCRTLPVEVAEHMQDVSKLYLISFQGLDAAILSYFHSITWLVMSHCENQVSPEIQGHIFAAMPQLQTLKLMNCNIEIISPRLSDVKQLEFLDLSNNQLPNVPEFIGDLKQLRTLIMAGNKLQIFSDRITNLENLETIDLSRNQLSRVPQQLSLLVNLKELMLDRNRFTEFSTMSWLSQNSLSSINLAHNKRLEWLVLPVPGHQALTHLNLDGCENLSCPPSAIAEQGLQAIKLFFLDSEAELFEKLPSLTVGVIGKSYSGKTSVIESLRKGKRYLTKRMKGDPSDETTTVFNHKKLKMDSVKEIRIIDLGGNGVYHPTYQIALKADFIPVIVVNLHEFKTLATQDPREAVKQLCFDWIAHFYLANPDLGPPLLVLTHKDKLSETDVSYQMKVFIRTVELLRRQTWITIRDRTAEEKHGPAIRVFSDENRQLFQRSNIFVVGDDPAFDQFDGIIQCIDEISCGHIKFLPPLWLAMIADIESFEASYLDIQSLESLYQQNIPSLKIVLRLMHKSGRLLWLEDCPQFPIFHDFISLRSLIALLFNHDATKQWEERIQEYVYVPNSFVRLISTKIEFENHVFHYQQTGLISEELLNHVIGEDSTFPIDIALGILQKFRLIHGPIVPIQDGLQCYVVPYFTTEYNDRSWKSDGEFQLRVLISFESMLPLPHHIYHELSIVVLDSSRSPDDKCTVARNGAKIFHGGSTTHFIHHYHEANVTLQVSTSVHDLCRSWGRMRMCLENLLTYMKSTWKGTHPAVMFCCGSCLLTQQLRPHMVHNPRWMLSDEMECDENDEIHCLAEGADVPAAFLKPCKNLSPERIVELRSYRETHLSLLSGETAGGGFIAVPTDLGLQQSNQAGYDGHGSDPFRTPDILMDDTALDNIDLVPHATPDYIKHLFPNDDKVYLMSERIRGRVLIVSNAYSSSPRPGSEQDFNNLKIMFERFHFDVVGEHKDYTAKDICDTIIAETKRPEHNIYGMFVLAIMSHGTDGVIHGNDDWSVRLQDIYGLLGGTKFPAMAHKPKLVIVQSCSDGLMDNISAAGGEARMKHAIPKKPIKLSTSDNEFRDAGNLPNYDATEDQNVSLRRSHFLVLKSSLPEFGSMRHHRNGSWLIRAIVIMFSRYGHCADLRQLAENVRAQVELKSIEKCVEKTKPKGQIPDISCTFTGDRAVYLFPNCH